VGGSSSAAAHAAAASAPSLPIAFDSALDAEVLAYLLKLSTYIEEMERFKKLQNSQPKYGGRGGGGGGGGASSSSSSSSNAFSRCEPQVPKTEWRILTPALHALAKRERLLPTRKPVSLFRGLHAGEEADIAPTNLKAQPQMRGDEDDSDGKEAQQDMDDQRELEQCNRVEADHFRSRSAFRTDASVVVKALGAAGSLTKLIAGHANGLYSACLPSDRPTRSFTSLPQIAEHFYAREPKDGGGSGKRPRKSSSIMVTFHQGDGLLVGMNMNHERLFPRESLTHIGTHEFVFIGPSINLDAVRVIRWHPQYDRFEKQMGGNRYGHSA